MRTAWRRTELDVTSRSLYVSEFERKGGKDKMEDPKLIPLPLQWTLRAHFQSTLQTFTGNYTPVMDVATIHDWLCLDSALAPSSVFLTWNKKFVTKSRAVATFSLFQSGILPEWESEENSGGHTLSAKLLPVDDPDGVWRLLVLDCARGRNDFVNGIFIGRKIQGGVPVVRVEVWTRRGSSSKPLSYLKKTYHPSFQLVPRK